MTFKRIVEATLALSVAATIALVGLKLSSQRVHADDDNDSEARLIAIGLRIAPPFLNMEGKDRNLVGLGSFIANAQADCNGCHGSDPANEYLPTNNPFFLKPLNNHPALFNQATYLNGGQNFGPVGPGVVQDPSSPLFGGPGLGPNIITRNLTPDNTGLPAGGTDLEKFMKIIRTGHDPDKLHLNCGTIVNGSPVTDNCYNFPVDGSLLQVMPWPKFRHMTDHQLEALWTFLSAVPCNAHNDKLGDMFPWLKNAC
jgi:hypothetical protein